MQRKPRDAAEVYGLPLPLTPCHHSWVLQGIPPRIGNIGITRHPFGVNYIYRLGIPDLPLF